MPALTNLTKSADIATTARIITFLTRFNDDWAGLRQLYGIMRPIRRAPGSILKSKYAEMTLQSGSVAEGAEIPFSKAEVKEKDYASITIEKYAKSVSLEAIDGHGYEDSILKTDREFRRQLMAKVQNAFFSYLQTGTLYSSQPTFQAAVAMAVGLIQNKWDEMDRGLTEIVGWANYLDVANYLGTSTISTQNQHGMNYLENFIGISRLFTTSKIPQGMIFATPVENIDLYYIDPSDSQYARAGLVYTSMSDVPGVDANVQNLVGFHAKADYDRATSNIYAIMGLTLFSEYLDGIASVGFGSTGALTVSSAAGTAPGDTAITVDEEQTTGNVYKYMISDSVSAAPEVTMGADVTAWTTWDGESDITAATGKGLTLVEASPLTIDASTTKYRAVKSGVVSVTAKT